MIRKSGCTTSNISIDYLVKKKFNIFVEYDEFGFDWTASREDVCLHAFDPSSLVALYMIREDWAAKKHVPNYYGNLIYGREC
jgi:hypothetical protein